MFIYEYYLIDHKWENPLKSNNLFGIQVQEIKQTKPNQTKNQTENTKQRVISFWFCLHFPCQCIIFIAMYRMKKKKTFTHYRLVKPLTSNRNMRTIKGRKKANECMNAMVSNTRETCFVRIFTFSSSIFFSFCLRHNHCT